MTLLKTISSDALIRLDSKRSLSFSSVGTEDSSSSASDDSSMNRPVLHRRRDASGKKPTRNSHTSTGENNKAGSSTQRLKHFKKKLASTLVRKGDAYQKINIDTSSRFSSDSSRVSNGGESKRAPSRSNSSKSDEHLRPGVRRAASDDLNNLFKAVSRVRGRQDSDGDRDSPDEPAARRHSSHISNIRIPDYSPGNYYLKNKPFVPTTLTNALSTPNLFQREAPPTGRKIPTPNGSFSSRASSKASSKSSNDLLIRAAAVAGRKQRRKSNQPSLPRASPMTRSSTVAIMQTAARLNAQQQASSNSPFNFATTGPIATQNHRRRPEYLIPQPAHLISPHAMATTGPLAIQTSHKQRRQSDSAMDLAFFRKHLESLQSSPNFSPINKDRGKREERSSSSRDNSSKTEYTGISNNRRRSKRHHHNEIMMEPKQAQNKNNADKRQVQQAKDLISQRKDKFREDFPDDPIPSDAILLRLYSNIPPPPPYNNHSEDLVLGINDVEESPLAKRLTQSILSSEDLKKNVDTSSCFSSVEWKESVDKTRKNTKFKFSPSDDNPNDASRRSESSKSKNSSSSTSRRSGQREQKSDDHSRSRSRNAGHKSRLASKVKGETSTSGRDIRSNESSMSTHDTKVSKRKGKRRDGMSVSTHGRGKKKGEPVKVKNKNVTLSPKPSSPETPRDRSHNSMRDLSHNSLRSMSGKGLSHGSSDGFQLDLSNGSFSDSMHDVSNHTTRDSLGFLRTSLTKMNSVRSFNDAGNRSPQPSRRNSLTSSYNNSGHKSPLPRRSSHSGGHTSSTDSFAETDDTRRRRRGKRGSSVGSERKSRSRSAEGRTGVKTRRGRRGSRSKPSTDESSRVDESGSFEFEASTNDHRPTLSREGSRKIISDESGGKHRRHSPKVTSRKGNENGTQHRHRSSPKVVSKNFSRDENGGKTHKSLVRKNSRNIEPSSSPRSTSRKKVSAPSSPVKNKKREFDGPQSRIVNYQNFTPISPKFGKDVSKLDKEQEEDNFYDLALSSWVDRPEETTKPTSSSKNPEPPRRLESLKKNSRWLPDESHVNRNGINTTAARVTHFPDPEPKPEQKLDFPLNFVEYEDVSPLTIASKKVRGGIGVNNGFPAPLSYIGS